MYSVELKTKRMTDSAKAGEKPEGIVEHNLGAVEYCITALAGRKPEDDRNSQQQYSSDS